MHEYAPLVELVIAERVLLIRVACKRPLVLGEPRRQLLCLRTSTVVASGGEGLQDLGRQTWVLSQQRTSFSAFLFLLSNDADELLLEEDEDEEDGLGERSFLRFLHADAPECISRASPGCMDHAGNGNQAGFRCEQLTCSPSCFSFPFSPSSP